MENYEGNMEVLENWISDCISINGYVQYDWSNGNCHERILNKENCQVSEQILNN